jgi:hypothetical protein
MNMDNYQEQINAKMAEAEKILGAPLTEREKDEFKYHTVGAIVGIKHIRSLDSDALKAVLTDKTMGEALRRRIGSGTNPSWVVSIVAETLYFRHEIDEIKLDYLMEHGYLGEVKIDL